MPIGEVGSVKGLSVLLTVLLLVLAHHLSVRLGRAGALPAQHELPVQLGANGLVAPPAPSPQATLATLREL